VLSCNGTDISLGELIDSGTVVAITGFPYGGHNEHGEGVPHIRPFNVAVNGDIALEQLKSIPADVAEGKPKLQRGDILFNNTNSKELVGKCAFWSSNETFAFSNHMTRIRVSSESCDAAYLSYALLHHWITGKSQLLARSHVAQASIVGERFREIRLPWPRLDEQRSISKVIDQVRAGARIAARQLDQAQDLKKVIMRELFTRGLRNESQKDSEIGAIPESWDVVRLGSLGRIGNGSTPKKSIAEYWNDGTFPWLTSAKVYDRNIESADQFVSELALKECHLPIVKPGAVLVAITGQGKTLGHCAVLRTEATINQHLAYLQTDFTKADPGFIRSYIETQYDYLRQIASGGGSTKGALTCAFLRSLPVPLPPMDQQSEIALVLDAIDNKIDTHRKKREVLEQLFNALLHKLMTGEIRTDQLDLSTLKAA
jgi:type I restriction enzyme, S subunit